MSVSDEAAVVDEGLSPAQSPLVSITFQRNVRRKEKYLEAEPKALGVQREGEREGGRESVCVCVCLYLKLCLSLKPKAFSSLFADSRSLRLASVHFRSSVSVCFWPKA